MPEESAGSGVRCWKTTKDQLEGPRVVPTGTIFATDGVRQFATEQGLVNGARLQFPISVITNLPAWFEEIKPERVLVIRMPDPGYVPVDVLVRRGDQLDGVWVKGFTCSIEEEGTNLTPPQPRLVPQKTMERIQYYGDSD